MRHQTLLLLTLTLLLSVLSCKQRNQFSVEVSGNPAASGSIAPNITETGDGRVLLSWIENGENTLALRFAARDKNGWSTPQTIVTRQSFDKYAEAPAWVVMLPNGTLLAVWAEELPSKEKWPGNYLYAAVSRDQGKNWSKPVVIHSDRSNSEHSFASVAVRDENHADIVWLDARDYMAKHKYRLMSAVISGEGSIENEETIDDDVCTCCPTALARSPRGLIAAYRDHTSQEVRDIYVVRNDSGRWQTSRPIHEDGWHINACPVNGPALASRDNELAAAWYTGAEEQEAVRIAFSNDAGVTFEPPVTLDSSGKGQKPIGRPALTFLSSNEVLVSWIRYAQDHAELVAALTHRNGPPSPPFLITSGSAQGLGYPRMQALGAGVLISWGGAGEAKEINTAVITPH